MYSSLFFFIVKPAITIPTIEECSNTHSGTCIKSTADSVEVNCFVRDSRPALNLSWTIKTNGGDRILPSNYMNFTTDNVTYISHVTATFSFGDLSFLSLLVCRANSVPLNLVEEENVILVEKEMDYPFLATPIRRYLKIHSAMNLSCTDLGLNLVVWKWSPQQYAFENLYISIFERSNHTKISNKEYKLEDEGSLFLQNTLVEHEGLYACVYDNGVSGGIVLYDVLVTVDPTPIFPVIDGCNHQQYCVLKKQPRDVLTCSVLGIRPRVDLEWRAVREETPIDFTQHQFTVTQMGDLYDISLTVNFDFPLRTQNKVTVECRAVGENAELFSLSTKIDLLFPYVLPTEQRLNTSTITILAVLVTMIIIITTVAVVIVCRIRDYSEKAEPFIGQLKSKYEIFYDSVQPIPYIKDRMYCVDKILHLTPTVLFGLRLARRKYVGKAVVGKCGEAVDKIMRKLEENPVLDDLCQVPLFFVMFAHMTYENEHSLTFNSVTSFFRYMISCFHSHMKNKMKDENVTNFELVEKEHKVLDKIAFEALSGKNQKLVWNREQLRNQLGHEFFDQYLRIGIFVAEEVLNIADTPNAQEHIQYNREVHFYHKTVCEWYAAHYVSDQLSGGNTDCIDEFLQNLDPFDLQYLYRFACGLNKIAGEKIIQYLQQKKESKKFAILCMLEQEDKTDSFIKSVSDLVLSEETYIRRTTVNYYRDLRYKY
ncbi:hypothetical protein BSL78_15187 [Apostichopus japonicus]|uniref:Ig-like domain-containing protein n=1 Tax=Stichopus japonicus TaxID=307972 RepID=A0A2G8KJ02_STIJA|nr:hypothetical protein BSL78_15187 [Apostichopus japonicus]